MTSLRVDARASVAQALVGLYADVVAEEALGTAECVLGAVARLAKDFGNVDCNEKKKKRFNCNYYGCVEGESVVRLSCDEDDWFKI